MARSLAVAVALALSGCGEKEEASTPVANNNPQSSEQVASAMGKVTIKPGEWEITQQVVDLQVTGAPKEMPVEAMRSAMSKVNVIKHCITPEQAAKPNADFLAAQKDSKCTYSGFNMDGGVINGSVTCPGGQGGKMTATMQGIYQPTSYALTMDMNMAGMSPGMNMVMKMKTNGKRIGECTAEQKEK